MYIISSDGLWGRFVASSVYSSSLYTQLHCSLGHSQSPGLFYPLTNIILFWWVACYKVWHRFLLRTHSHGLVQIKEAVCLRTLPDVSESQIGSVRCCSAIFRANSGLIPTFTQGCNLGLLLRLPGSKARDCQSLLWHPKCQGGFEIPHQC